MKKTIGLLFLFLVACGEPSDADFNPDDDSGVGIAVAADLELATAVRGPHVHVDHEGRKWNCEKPSKAQLGLVKAIERAQVPDHAQPPPFDDMSVEEVAEALRPVRSINDFDCIGEPNYELARKIKSNHTVPDTLPSPSESSDVVESESDSVNKTNCCGTDDRVASTTPELYKSIALGEQGGTIGFIRPGVAWTAAHVVYDTGSNAWMKVNRNNQGVVNWPYYRRETELNDATPETYGCYTVTVPGCWVSASSNGANGAWSCDYAVIDFTRNGSNPCFDPEPSENWFGTSTSLANSAEGHFMWTVGYPAYANLNSGGTVNSGLTFMYTRMNNTWGSNTMIDGVPMHVGGYGLDSNGVWMFHELDATQGDSGRPLTRYNNGYYLIGNHHGRYVSNGLNLDVLWTNVTYDFAEANSPFPN